MSTVQSTLDQKMSELESAFDAGMDQIMEESQVASDEVASLRRISMECEVLRNETQEYWIEKGNALGEPGAMQEQSHISQVARQGLDEYEERAETLAGHAVS